MHRVVDIFRHAALTCGFTFTLDKRGTLTNATRARRIARALGGLLMGVLCLLPVGSKAYAVEVTNRSHIITYAGSLLTPLELSAAITLWTKESNIRVNARNGSHVGICQGRSKYLLKANYKQQVRWCIHYSWDRYGSMVNALHHWKMKGWH